MVHDSTMTRPVSLAVTAGTTQTLHPTLRMRLRGDERRHHVPVAGSSFCFSRPLQSAETLPKKKKERKNQKYNHHAKLDQLYSDRHALTAELLIILHIGQTII